MAGSLVAVVGEGEEVEAVPVRVIGLVSFLLGLTLLIFGCLGIILNWSGNFWPFLIFSIPLLVTAYFFLREHRQEKVELGKRDDRQGGDSSESNQLPPKEDQL